MPPKILLATAAAWIGVSRVPRILAEAGGRVSLLSHPRRFAARSRHVAELHPAPLDVPGALDALKRLLAERPFDWVILGDDEILRAAMKDRAAWPERWYPAGDAAELLVSKAAFARAMGRSGIPFPASEVAVGPAEARAAAGRIGLPVIVKPDASTGGVGLFRAHAPADLARVPEGAVVVVQRFVEGDVGSTAFLLREGRPLCWMSAFKHRVHPAPFGPSSVRRYVHLPAAEELLAALGALLPMTGLCGVDWILPRGSPEPLLLELNGRPTPWLHLHRPFGVDLPRAIRSMLEGTPEVVRPPAEARRAVVRMFPQDAIRALDEGDWRGLLSGLFACGDAPLGEPMLFYGLAKYLLRRAGARVRGR